jgi:orotate phosphoribosyltransferase
MVKCNVLRFGDFTTKSGRKTPFFINTGNYDSGEQLHKLGQFYAEALAKHMGEQFNVLFGPAYKGIPLAASTSMILASQYNKDIRFCFNRKEAKDHGEGGTMIGHKCVSGDKVVIIEDVTTAGTSVRETVSLFSDFPDVKICGLIVSVDRQEKGQGTSSALQELRDEFGIKTLSIVTLDEIIEYLCSNKIDGKLIIDNEIHQKIVEYRKLYGAQ